MPLLGNSIIHSYGMRFAASKRQVTQHPDPQPSHLAIIVGGKKQQLSDLYETVAKGGNLPHVPFMPRTQHAQPNLRTPKQAADSQRTEADIPDYLK